MKKHLNGQDIEMTAEEIAERENIMAENNVEDTKVFFIAPKIHQDLERFTKHANMDLGINSVCHLETKDFVDNVASKGSLLEIYENIKF